MTFGTLPGDGVLGAAVAPELDGSLVFFSGRTGLQLHQPVGGFTEDQRVDLGSHQATLRQAMKASRMSRLTVISDTPSCSAICG